MDGVTVQEQPLSLSEGHPEYTVPTELRSIHSGKTINIKHYLHYHFIHVYNIKHENIMFMA